METKIVWKGGMAFESELNGFTLKLDGGEKVGGKGLGMTPKPLTLVSLAGCTGMDVVSILKKKRVELEGFEVVTRAVLAESHPKKFEEIVLQYRFEGQDLDSRKLQRAIELSMENYCGVSASLRPGVRISYEIVVNGRLLTG